MAWTPISNIVPQFAKDAAGTSASGYYLKFYSSGTITPINMATDSTGGTTLAKCQLNSLGYPINGSSAVFIPHLSEKYKAVLYANDTDADANTFGNAVWVVDGLEQQVTTSTSDFVKFTDLSANAGTSLIGHISSLTNAVATTSQAKHREIKSVKADFGAVADNSTNDTTAIQNAINAVNASYIGGTFGGEAGIVYLPAGVYRISGLTLKKGVSLVGEGQGNTILLLDADGGTGLKTPAKASQVAADQIEQSEIRGITFGIHSSLTPTVSTILMDTSGMSRCYFEDINFVVPSNVIGVDNTGNTLAGSGGPAHWHNTWMHCFVDVSGGIGVRWGDNDSSIGEQVLAQIWVGGQIKGTSGIGIHMRGSTGNAFHGTQFQGLKTGANNCIIIGDTTGTRVSTSNSFHGCYFEECRIVQYSNTNRNQRWGGFETGVVETDNGDRNGRIDYEQTYRGWSRNYVSGRITTPTTINKGYNLASITKVGTGIYDCTFTNALPDTNYVAIAQAESSDALPRISTKTTGAVRVVFENRAGTAVDPTSFVITVQDNDS